MRTVVLRPEVPENHDAVFAVHAAEFACMDQHRHEEFLKFMRTVDKEVPIATSRSPRPSPCTRAP